MLNARPQLLQMKAMSQQLSEGRAKIPVPAPIRRPANRTGLPDDLKAGVESLSGLSMDDVKVHYGSGMPAQLQALAYTRGAEIHVGPGQERHLAHEAWHVVQQKQGRVKPTLQAKGMGINDDDGLEREADIMGAQASRARAGTSRSIDGAIAAAVSLPNRPIGQRKGWTWKDDGSWEEVDPAEEGQQPDLDPEFTDGKAGQIYDDQAGTWCANADAYTDRMNVVRKLKAILGEGLGLPSELGAAATPSADLGAESDKIHVNTLLPAHAAYGPLKVLDKERRLNRIKRKYEHLAQARLPEDPADADLEALAEAADEDEANEEAEYAQVRAEPDTADTPEAVEWAAVQIAIKAIRTKAKGAIPVLLEQKGDELPVVMDQESVHILSDRAHESMLIVLNMQNFSPAQQEEAIEHGDLVSETFIRERIPASSFFKVLLPQEFQGYFTEDEILQHSLIFVGSESGRFEYGSGGGIPFDISVPDYASSLIDILAENADRFFQTHAVRLGKRNPLKRNGGVAASSSQGESSQGGQSTPPAVNDSSASSMEQSEERKADTK